MDLDVDPVRGVKTRLWDVISRILDLDFRRQDVVQRRIATTLDFGLVRNAVAVGIAPGWIRRKFSFASVVKPIAVSIDTPRIAGRLVRLVGICQCIGIRPLKNAFGLTSTGRSNDRAPLDSFSMIVESVTVGVDLRRVTRDVELEFLCPRSRVESDRRS